MTSYLKLIYNGSKKRGNTTMKIILDEIYNSKVHTVESLTDIFEDYMIAYPKEDGYIIEFLISDTFYRIKIYQVL